MSLFRRFFLPTFFSSCAFLSAFSYADVTTQDHQSIEDLMRLQYSKEAFKDGIAGALNADEMKLREMKNMAMAIGSQNGYVSRINALKIEIDKEKDQLDSIYDFSVLMKLSGGQLEEIFLLPPVISVTRNMTTVSDESDRIRISGTMYKIDKPARLVTIAPNWRQYLLFDQPVEITKPIPNLLPKTPAEKLMWQTWINDAWVAGNMQAEREMTYRARKLGSDFKGMTKYMILASEGKVTKPVVSSSTMKIDGGGNVMRINDRVVQLSLPASLNPDNNDWAALILDARESVRYPEEKNLQNK